MHDLALMTRNRTPLRNVASISKADRGWEFQWQFGFRLESREKFPKSWRRRATAESSCEGFSIVRRKLSGRVQWSASSASQSDSHWSKQSSPLLLYTRRNDFPSFSTSSPNRFPSLGCTFNRKKRLRAVRVAFSLQVNFVELGSELESVNDDQSF